MLTASRLRELLEYDPETGVFTWLPRPRAGFATERSWLAWNARFSGEQAGGLNAHGHRQIMVDWVSYYAHRLAWLYMTGEWPVGEIDHENGAEDDNRFANLRDVSHAENGRNCPLSKNNKSGVNGVRWDKRTRKWCASIKVNRRNKFIGYFDNIAAAAAARKAADAANGFHLNHGRTAV